MPSFDGPAREEKNASEGTDFEKQLFDEIVMANILIRLSALVDHRLAFILRWRP